MGILDDAIREHLELIRRRGEPESELQRLEDEAFGPPTRPDEADFPESQEAEAPSGNGAAAEADLHDEAATEGPAVGNEDVTRMIPAAGASEAPPAAEEGAAEQESIEAQEIEEEPDYEGELPAEEPEDEPVAGVHPIVESAEDQEEPPSEELAMEEPPSDEVAVAPEEATSLYDQSADDAPDFNDLNLELEDAAPAAEPPSEEHELHEPAGAIPLEPPIESLDTVEHAFPEEIVESEEGVEESDQAADEQAEAALPAHEDDEKRHKDEEGAEDEDVLADTPEFLKDAPEDDELWFEQGEPKDFDF